MRRALHELTEKDVVVILDDLEDRDTVLAIRDLVRQSAARVLVLTRCTEGPAWGAVLAGGAVGVMSVQSSVDDVAAMVDLACRGEEVMVEARRTRLEREMVRVAGPGLAAAAVRRVELLPVHEHALDHPLAGGPSNDGRVVPRPRQQMRDTVRH